jgi:hypothetical protein
LKQVKPLNWRRFWQIIRWLVGIALGVAVLEVLNGDKGELTETVKYLTNLNVFYLLVAVMVEALSLISYSYLQLRLLHAAGIKVQQPWIAMVSFAALTISISLPAGPAFSTIYTFGQYRKKNTDEIAAGWTIFATFAVTAMALAFLSALGAIIAYGESSSADLLLSILVVFVLVALIFTIFWKRNYAVKILAGLLALSHRLLKRPRQDPTELIGKIRKRISSIEFGRKDFFYIAAFGFGNWVFDCACLAVAFLAVGADIPWRGLLLAYGAGQLAQNLPITPGGLGVTEGSLTIALVAFGSTGPASVAAVLLYRIISFWAYLPLGWLDYVLLRITESRKAGLPLREKRDEADIMATLSKSKGSERSIDQRSRYVS